MFFGSEKIYLYQQIKKDIERIAIHAPHPSIRQVSAVTEMIRKGKIVAYPTDSLLAVGCDPSLKKSVIQLCKIKKIDPERANLSYLCAGMADASVLIRPIDKELYRLIRRNTPGPFTFIMHAGKEVPHHFNNKRKTIGIRIPSHYFTEALLADLGRPLISISLASGEEEQALYPDQLVTKYSHQLDLWIDDDQSQGRPSTVLDCTVWPPDIIRDGGHELQW